MSARMDWRVTVYVSMSPDMTPSGIVLPSFADLFIQDETCSVLLFNGLASGRFSVILLHSVRPPAQTCCFATSVQPMGPPGLGAIFS